MDETDEERGTWLSVFQWIVEKKKNPKKTIALAQCLSF